MPIDDHQQRYLTAAQGFLELGMPVDADAELNQIDPFARHLPEVLGLRVIIYRMLQKWELMQTVAKRLVAHEPTNPLWRIEWAYAARHIKSLDAAKEILDQAVIDFPLNSDVLYEMACLHCHLGNVVEAKRVFLGCLQLDPSLRTKALEDEELEPLWNSLC